MVSNEDVLLVTDAPVELVADPDHNATEVIQRSVVVGGHVGNTHRGRRGNSSTDKAWMVMWIRCFYRIELIERIPKSVVVGRRIVF